MPHLITVLPLALPQVPLVTAAARQLQEEERLDAFGERHNLH